MSKFLYFFTAEFPFGKGESFIENEIPVSSNYFEKIYLFPHSNRSSECRNLVVNAEVVKMNYGENIHSKSILINNYFFIAKTHLFEFVNCSNKLFFIKNIRYLNSLLIRGIHDAELIARSIKHPLDEVIFYSYWMNDWALALSVLKEKKIIKNFVFRCGGFDIYDERYVGNYLPFRYFIYKNASGIFPNSKMGEAYIKKKKIFPDKVVAKYWGTTDNGEGKFDEKTTFTLVSCSSIIPLKRVHLIVEILKNIKFEMHWIHFGDGECADKIKNIAKELLPINVKYSFKGGVSNQEVISFYKTNTVNLFITTSETEGLPVSIQEAISFGIPIVATNVGGVSEIVNEKTGFLITKNFEVKEVAKLISQFRISSKNSKIFRENVRNFWKENFNAEKVYANFSETIKKG